MPNAIERKEYALKRRPDGKLRVKRLGFIFVLTDYEWAFIKQECGNNKGIALLKSRIVDPFDEDTYLPSDTFNRILTEEEMAAKKGLLL